MNSLIQLESYTDELVTAIKTMTEYCRNIEVPTSFPHLIIPLEAPSEIHRARRTILANMSKVRTLLGEPADFLQHLASQVRIVPVICRPIFNSKLSGVEPTPRMFALAG
jgi:hypothetical protein